MNITTISELIAALEKIKAEFGDVPVVTDEYGGCEHDLREAVCNVRDGDTRAGQRVVIIGGGPRF